MALNTILCNEAAPIVCGEVMKDYMLDCTMRQASRIWDIGVVRRTPRAEQFAASCNMEQKYKFWLPTDYQPGGIVSCGLGDVPGDEGCPACENIGQGAETLFKLYTRKCWTASDCEAQCMGCDEEGILDVVVNNLVSPYMVTDRVYNLFSEFTGLYNMAAADPEFAPAEDMIIDLGDACLDHCAGIDLNMLRDCGTFDALYVHKDVYRNMRKNGCLQEKACCGDTDFEFDALADGTAIIPVPKKLADLFMKDPADGCYISFAFNFGAFEYAEGCHKTPVERDRDPSANCGDGAESIWFRSEYVLRPLGTTFNTTSIARDYADQLELSDGANWSVDIPVEDFGIAFVKSCCTA